MYYTLDTGNDGVLYRMYIHEPARAWVAFQMDLASAHFYQTLIGLPAYGIPVQVQNDLVSGKGCPIEYRGDAGAAYEDTLALCEFFLNRLTSYSDKTLSSIMDGVRFSLCTHLQLDNEGWKPYIKSRKSNPHPFCTVTFASSDVKNLPQIDENGMKWGKNRVTFDVVLKSLDYMRENTEQSMRVPWDTAMGAHLSVKIDSGRGLVPLSQLIDEVMSTLRTVPPFLTMAKLDMKDIRNGRVCPAAPFLGELGDRDENLDSVNVDRLANLAGMEIGVGETLGESAILLDLCLYMRILHSIFASSGENVSMESPRISLKLDPRMLLMLLDSRIFGGTTHLSDVLFVGSADMMGWYEDALGLLGMLDSDNKRDLIVEPLKPFKNGWKPTNRARGNYSPGCICRCGDMASVTASDFRKRILKMKEPTIVVTDDENRDEVLSVVDSLVTKEDRSRIKMLVVTNRIPYVSVDDCSDDLVEIGVDTPLRFFRIHSNGVIARTRDAISDTARDLDAWQERMDDGTLLGDILHEFDEFRMAMEDALDDIENRCGNPRPPSNGRKKSYLSLI